MISTSLKSFLLLLNLFLFSNSFCQPVFPLNTEKEVEFSNVIQIDSSDKNELFNNSKLWVVKNFKSANDVIQFENIDQGTIIGKGNFSIKSTGLGFAGTVHKDHSGIITFTFEISNKDNKTRIRIYDISHKAKYSGGAINNTKPECGGMTMTVKTWNTIQQQAFDEITATLNTYEAHMKKSKIKSNEDW